MKRIAAFSVILGLATAGSAFAEQKEQQAGTETKPQPVQMSEAQMDNVAGGALVFIGPGLINVDIEDVAQNIQVAVPVTAAIGNVGVLSGPQLADVMAAQRGISGQVGRIRP